MEKKAITAVDSLIFVPDNLIHELINNLVRSALMSIRQPQ
jgi:hypothetical protein